MRLVARLETVGLFLVIVCYMAALYSLVSTNYTVEKLRPPVTAQVQFLLPKVRASLVDVVNEVKPLYVELAREKFEEVLPDLQQATVEESAKLTESLSGRVTAQIEGTLARLEKRQWDRLVGHYPELADMELRLKYQKQWRTAIEEEASEILVDFQERYGNDVALLHQSLDGFRPNQFENFTEQQLTRYFAHLWLMVLDRHLLDQLGD